ncbi:hypothetical protein FS837_002043 [Tulasnella sp. UAMH 9824]|nr:hypothetical protein FS837_002043 [Tulasnella sp. UAMH 9824]
MDVSAFYPERRWYLDKGFPKLSAENVLATQMFDTLVPSIERHMLATAARLVEFNSGTLKILPVSRRQDLIKTCGKRRLPLAARRGDQVESRLQSFRSSWASFHKILDFYEGHPIPQDSQASLVGKFMTLVFQQEPLHSSPEEYQSLLDSSRHLTEECVALHATLENLANFFRQVIRQYDEAGGSPAWSSKLDFHALSQRGSAFMSKLVNVGSPSLSINPL